MSADLTLTVQETGPGSAYELTGDQVAALVAVPDLVRLTRHRAGAGMCGATRRWA
ncbi:hypothetical protein OHB07_38605 (plasmid) [Streptomyces sp. NBC_00111]|uniref:hypothetical protein n=1 Tax=Streptomyces sp. NBC_00111 TaxID=2975655 RepID=UPI002F907DC4